MKYFFDTEFMEDGHNIELLSIGIVSEDGRSLYLENNEADYERANEWVKEHVIPKLRTGEFEGYTRADIADMIRKFCDPDKHGKPEFWGYYADYDWVVLCQLFGRMIDLPKGWPMYCMDLKQLCVMMGDMRLPQLAPEYEHNALHDAGWNRQMYHYIINHGDNPAMWVRSRQRNK